MPFPRSVVYSSVVPFRSYYIICLTLAHNTLCLHDWAFVETAGVVMKDACKTAIILEYVWRLTQYGLDTDFTYVRATLFQHGCQSEIKHMSVINCALIQTSLGGEPITCLLPDLRL